MLRLYQIETCGDTIITSLELEPKLPILTMVVDYGLICSCVKKNMQEVAISEFKAKCLAMLEQVRKTKKPIRITRRGQPVAEIVPPSAAKQKNWLGSMKGTGEILGDIVSPVIALNDFEVMRD